MRSSIKLWDNSYNDIYNKLGVLYQESEIDEKDMMFGLTNKFFGQGYKETKNAILLELKSLSNQIECYLNL